MSKEQFRRLIYYFLIYTVQLSILSLMSLSSHTLWTTPWIFLNIATLLINQFSTKPRPLILLWCVCPVLAWPRAWRCIAWTRLILPWAAAAEVPPLDELRVVNHPEAAEVVLVAHEAFVQRQVRANGILQVRAAAGRKRKGKRRKDY